MQCETALNRVTSSDTVSITGKAAGISRKAATRFQLRGLRAISLAALTPNTVIFKFIDSVEFLAVSRRRTAKREKIQHAA